MAVVPTALTVTPIFDGTKRMTVVGTVAVNETVAVTVVGVNDVTVPETPVLPVGMVIRLVSQCGRVEFARFPSEDGDVWTAVGANATCALALNTAALRLLFRYAAANETREVDVELGNGVTNNLYGMARFVIRNWIQNPLDPVAGSSQLQGQIDVLTGRLETHQHDDTVAGESSFPHNNLSGRDVAGAHPTIEAGVASALSAAATAQSTAEVAGSNASAALGVAQDAKAVTDAIQDNGVFSAITRHMNDTDTKAILNQVITWLNARRHV